MRYGRDGGHGEPVGNPLGHAGECGAAKHEDVGMILLDGLHSLLDHHLVGRRLVIRQLRTRKGQASDRCDLRCHSKVCDDVLVRPRDPARQGR